MNCAPEQHTHPVGDEPHGVEAQRLGRHLRPHQLGRILLHHCDQPRAHGQAGLLTFPFTFDCLLNLFTFYRAGSFIRSNTGSSVSGRAPARRASPTPSGSPGRRWTSTGRLATPCRRRWVRPSGWRSERLSLRVMSSRRYWTRMTKIYDLEFIHKLGDN